MGAPGGPAGPRTAFGRRLCYPRSGSRQPLTAAASSTTTSEGSIVWSRDDVAGDATFAFTNLYQSGAPQEAVKTTADAAFGALATWLSEQQRLVERAFAEQCS